MAKVSQETNLAVEELEPEVEENESNSKESKQKYFGGVGVVYQTVAEAKENPITLEDGAIPVTISKRTDKETGEVTESENDTFKLFEIRDVSNDDKPHPVGYLWSRSNQTALAEYAEIALNLEAGQYGAKRGRSKVFKPDQGTVALAMQIRNSGDQKYIDMFKATMPEYNYIFVSEPAVENI